MALPAWLSRPPAPRVAPLEGDAARRLAALHATAFARPWDALEFERLLAERGVTADGLFLGSAREPAGFALSRSVLDEAEILTVVIAPEARGRGYGGLLLAGHLAALVRRGVRTVHLEVEEGNDAALALYRRQGFREVGRRDGYYPRPDGRRAAALLLSAGL